MNYDKIAVLGGDKRQLFAADELRKNGFEVYLAGFDKLESCGELKIISPDEALDLCGVVLFPVTGAAAGVIDCPFSDNCVLLDEIKHKLIDKLVFAGKSKSFGDIEIIDILSDEEFAARNALPSAEGAVLVALESYEATLAGSDTLVIGYGRIGKRLSRLLKAMNSRVTVATRSRSKASNIILDGNTPVNTAHLKTLSGYDVVFNTADALVVDKNILMNTDPDVLLIDLASLPGGVDFESGSELGFTALRALALPGKYSPRSAGKVVSDIVTRKLKEEFYCQNQA